MAAHAGISARASLPMSVIQTWSCFGACAAASLSLASSAHSRAVLPPTAMLVKPSSGQSCSFSSFSKCSVAGESVPQLSPMMRMRVPVAVALALLSLAGWSGVKPAGAAAAARFSMTDSDSGTVGRLAATSARSARRGSADAAARRAVARARRMFGVDDAKNGGDVL